MGFPAFAKIFRYGILAAVALAAALLTAIALASPASAWRDGGGRGLPARVDTDNLKYWAGGYTYSAKSFGIPYLEPNNRGSEAACGGGGVADAFFQRSSIRNDMPVVDTSKSSFALTTPSAAGACTAFVQEQNRAQSEAGSNGGYYLDTEGRLRRGLPQHFATTRAASNDRVVSSNSSSNGFWVSNGRIHYTTQTYPFASYVRRVDLKVGSDVQYAVVPTGTKFVIPATPVAKSARSGGSVRWVPDFSQVSDVTISNAKALRWGTGQAGSYVGAYCPSLLHPRGEDAVRRIGTGTGRTLSSLKLEANVQTANRFWCRSDKRYVISYETEIEPGVTCSSTDSAPPCPSKFRLPANGEEARYYGRVNCYRTVLELKTTATSQTDRNSCAYIFPLPQCTHNGAKTPLNSVQIAKHQIGAVFPFASDGTTACDTNPQCTANGAKRDMTDAELQAYRTARGASFTPASDGSTPCTAAVAASATADFTSDACVTAILEIYENRPKGFNAEPGVRADHRTITANAANPAFDLDVAAAHPGTASPPRAASDPSGCADGSEGRADHGTAGSAARKNTAAEDAVTTDEVDLPKSSSSINSQHPPHSKNFGSPGTDYTGAVRNIAHRFASDVAENNCAAAREFAELVLEILKGRRLVFQSYIDGYENTINTAITGYSSYSTTIQSGSENSANAYNNLSLKEMRQNALERQREKYVKDRQAYLAALKAALENAETEYQRATNSTKLVLGSINSNGCINSYDNAITGEIAKLKNLAAAAETAFPSNPIARNVTLTNKTYRATNSITSSNETTGGTDRFMRLYNALSLESYTNQVPAYNVTSSPESDNRPADNNLTWNWKAGEGWSLPTTTYSCAHLWTSGYAQETYLGAIQCVKRRQDTSPVSKSCPAGYSIKPVLLGERCSRKNKDGKEETTSVTYSCNTGWTRRINPNNLFQYICSRSVVDSTRTAQSRNLYKRTKEYRNVVSGTVTGTLSGTTGKKADFSQTYTGSRICEYATVNFTSSHTSALRPLATINNPQCGIIAHNAATGTTEATARATVIGTAHQITLPSTSQMTTVRPSALAAVTESSLLGKLHPSHSSRANLKAATTAARNTAAANLGTLTQNGGGSTVVPSSFAAALNYAAVGPSAYAARFAPPASTAQRTAIATAATNYINEYAKAYQTAYNQAAGDMGTTATTTTWNNFYWSYETSSLVWGGYLADEGQPTRSRGCYLIDVAADGKVTVQTARMDFETGSYAVGETYSFLFSGERNCKVRRTRTPQLNLKYQPDNPNGTDGGLATGYFHTDYQPNTADERFKLQAETEIFTIRAKVADSPPVFCGTTLPADGYLSHTAGQMPSVPAVIAKDSWRSAAQLTTTVLRPTSNPPAITKDHCFARPRLTATDKPRLVVFDDTAHSDMNLVYLQKGPADTTGINLFTGGAFTRYALETYQYPGDNSQQSVFYGAIWEPPDALGSSTGWDILDDNNPNTDLNTKIKNRIVARDKQAAPNLPAVPADTNFKHVSAMSFNIGFLDCRPDIENVVFIGNITSATSASNQANDYAGITSASGYPMDAPQWYYPAWNEIKGQTRADGSTVAVGTNSRIYTHPQSSRYGWVMAAYNNIATDKQPVVGFWNRPDVKHDDPNRPATVSLEEHRRVCLGDRSALLHYRSANAALPTSNTNRDVLGYPTDPSPPPGLSQVLNSWLVLHINPENKCPRLPASQPPSHPDTKRKKIMNFSLTKAEQDFAEEVRTWLEEHLVGEFAQMRGKGGTGQEDLEPELLIEWERELAKGGWLGLDYPEELGGRAHTLIEQVVFYTTYVEAVAPGRIPNMGVTLLGPTLLAFGTEEQQHRFIPPILSGEEFWCQGYSEPNAGSDLANVATKASLEGDRWVINGQKVWTSLAQFSDWCFVVARTEEGTERHRGLSYLMVPMNQEGVEIRPIVQITGGSEFNEVFFTDAQCDADMVVGEPGSGWAVAMGTLEFERGASFLGQQLAYAQEFEDLLAYAKATGATHDPLVRDGLAKSFCELEIMRYNNLRMLSAVAAAEDQESFLPGPEMSIGKLYWSHWHRDFGELAMNVHGAASLHAAENSGYEDSSYPLSRYQRTFLYSRAHTIYAGSSEIQKNIIGERVLRLPR